MSQLDNSCYGPSQDKVRETSGSILLLTIRITGLRAFLSSSKHLSNGCSVNIADAVTAVNIELANKMYNSASAQFCVNHSYLCCQAERVKAGAGRASDTRQQVPSPGCEGGEGRALGEQRRQGGQAPGGPGHWGEGPGDRGGRVLVAGGHPGRPRHLQDQGHGKGRPADPGHRGVQP